MDPGTILSIVQLSLSAFELGSKIAREFLSKNDKIPDKLKRLNERLGRFHNVVKDIVQEPPKHNASSNLAFPGADGIIETLSECKEFLRQYESALSSRSTVVGASQRVALLVGPDNSKVDELDRRIMYHYTELQYWKTVAVEDAVKKLGESMVAMHVSPRIPGMTGSPQPESSARFAGGQSTEYYMAQSANQPGFPRSPTLKANPRNPALPPINELELPSPRAGNNYAFDVAAQRQFSRSPGSAPVMAYISHNRQDTVGSASTLCESEYNIGPLSHSPLSTTPPQFRAQGHAVWLRIGSRRYQFNTNCYRVFDSDNNRVVEWYNTGSGVTIWHYVPNRCSIPHTKPTDEKFRVFFLPPSTKHHFKITGADNQTEDVDDRAEYQFARKIDRETFQQNLRGYDSLEMIRASKIHSAGEKDIATLEHLKVWRQTDHDDKPTFSFAAHGAGHPLHNEEFYIRWFKKTPELKGDTRLILKLYSKGNDQEDGIEIEGARRRSSTFGDKVRKLSGSSSHGGSRPSSRSRSSSSKSPAPVLYECCQGIEPPSDVRNLGHLEIEFKDSELRKNFIKACYEAHRPAMDAVRNTTPSPALSQHTFTMPPSLTLGPQQNPYELEDSSRHELMGDPGGYEMMGNPGVYEMGSPGFQIPSPSITTPYSPEEVRFNTETLFAPSIKSPSDQETSSYRSYDREPLGREPG
ncbi:hypothetical protein F4806DRAFT_163557 [Annulohypoxylon nitens]|nr:hypothetical protein F4806DRAFT_163557 [Annulohypoxylon nitens]